PEAPLPGGDARLGDLPADPAAVAGRAGRQPGLPLSGPAPPRAQGMDRGRVGQLREQPESPVLQPDALGPPAARRGDRELGTLRRRRRARPRGDLGDEMLRKIAGSIGALFGSRKERELDEELAFHIEKETEENVRRGMPPDEARRAALVRFGGVAKT